MPLNLHLFFREIGPLNFILMHSDIFFVRWDWVGLGVETGDTVLFVTTFPLAHLLTFVFF